MRKGVRQAMSGAQLGYWQFGGPSFEIHKDLGTIFYSAWELKSLEEAQAEKKSWSPTVTTIKAIQDAVHKSMKNWRESTVVPHFQVILHKIRFSI